MIKVSSILIGVSDLNKARSFYENVFDMKFKEFRPPFASAFLGDVEFNIEEYAEYREADWMKKYVGGRKQVSFKVDDLDQFLIKAGSFGANVLTDIIDQPWGWREVIIADQDNNEFVIEQEKKNN